MRRVARSPPFHHCTRNFSCWFIYPACRGVTASVQLVGVYLVFASLIIPALSCRCDGPENGRDSPLIRLRRLAGRFPAADGPVRLLQPCLADLTASGVLGTVKRIVIKEAYEQNEMKPTVPGITPLYIVNPDANHEMA